MFDSICPFVSNPKAGLFSVLMPDGQYVHYSWNFDEGISSVYGSGCFVAGMMFKPVH